AELSTMVSPFCMPESCGVSFLESESEEPSGLVPSTSAASPDFAEEDWSWMFSRELGEWSLSAFSTCALSSAFSSSPIMAARLLKLNIGSRLPGGGVPEPENWADGPDSTNDEDAEDALDICRRCDRRNGSAARGTGIEEAKDSWLVPERDN